MRTTTFFFLLETRAARPGADDELHGSPARGPGRRAGRGGLALVAPELLRPVEIPEGIAYLALAPDGEPALSSAPGPVLVEEVLLADRPHLLLAVLDPRGADLRLNGATAPRAALLEVGDELVLGNGPTLFVTRVRPGGVGPAGEAEGGRPCPVCRTPVRAEQRVARCECGAALHAEGEDVPAEARLQCVLSAGGTCPACGGEVHLEGGFAYVPPGRELAGAGAEVTP